jgi:hypothetical protein
MVSYSPSNGKVAGRVAVFVNNVHNRKYEESGDSSDSSVRRRRRGCAKLFEAGRHGSSNET